jgi:alpha-ketoglutarate-dependent taurine dioxygenase
MLTTPALRWRPASGFRIPESELMQTTPVPTGTMQRSSAAQPTLGPFNLQTDAAYRRWREAKLCGYPTRPEQLMVEIRNPAALTEGEREALVERCRGTNMVIYATAAAEHGKDVVRELGRQLGLTRLDSNLCADEDDITSLRVVCDGRRQGYIPYTSRPLSWHTDGYYNSPGREIRAWILHCACAAPIGGENALLDHEIAYLLLRDENPEHVAALMQPDAMTIPANNEEGLELRPEQSGPVFSIAADGSLHMRYTARKRNIAWKQDAATQAAVQALEGLLSGGRAHIFYHRLEPGQGVIANNVLHNRSGFSDGSGPGQQRLIYRARYYDRIAGTAMPEPAGPGVSHALSK